MKKIPNVGETVKFKMSAPSRKTKLSLEGKVKSTNKKFGGHIHIERGAVLEDEVIVRLESLA